ncbi:MAG: TIGR01906 family membrane protein [Planctomycetes bacterium]|nr:TIGR01906 family membrane protein [Planctomycetota bacterium]
MKRIAQLTNILISVMIPLFIFSSAGLSLLNGIFWNIEYNLPNFPPDPYGFTVQDRLHWSKLSIEYLFNESDISFLGDLNFSDGSSVFNDRELSHMVDVKRLVQATIALWCVLTILLAISCGYYWRRGWLATWGKVLSLGGWITVGVVITIILAILISFNTFFTDFHHLFFQGDSWLFAYSDTLIRLFPLRLWQDVFISRGILSLVFSGLAIFIGRKLDNKQ